VKSAGIRVTWCFFGAHECSFLGINDYVEFYFVYRVCFWLFLSPIYFQLNDHDDANWILANIQWQKWSIFILKTFIFLINRNGRISSIINITGFVHHNLAFKPFYTCISCQYISFTNRKLIYQIIWIAIFESHLLNGYKCYRSWLKCFRSERNWYYWMFSLITS